ncbi:MAG: DUF4124 domain-containing protein [Candidatus Contendobacter sp.]|nr:MAG: DUF4124 domain-containing protein [Candidatus Contendobacter sp.]
MLKRTLWLMLAVGCCGAVVTTQAQQFIYKWTDAQGMVKYSELAPPTGVKYEMVRKSSAAAGTEAALSSQQAKEQEELAREEAKQKEQAEQAKKETEDARAKNCEVARKNLQVLQGEAQVVKTDAQGKKVVLDAEQRAEELKKAQKDQDYFCNP